ncbi:MAG: transmembrane 220 family protein [Bacteroidota bacterium]
MKTLNRFFTLIFILFAALQYNDPDPYLWVPIYLFGALLCSMAIDKKYNPNLYMIGLSFYTVYGVYLLFSSSGVISWATDHDTENIAQSMQATKPWIEAAREFFGLLILLFVLTINRFWLKKVNTTPDLRSV